MPNAARSFQLKNIMIFYFYTEKSHIFQLIFSPKRQKITSVMSSCQLIFLKIDLNLKNYIVYFYNLNILFILFYTVKSNFFFISGLKRLRTTNIISSCRLTFLKFNENLNFFEYFYLKLWLLCCYCSQFFIIIYKYYFFNFYIERAYNSYLISYPKRKKKTFLTLTAG